MFQLYRDCAMIILRFHKTFQLRVCEWGLAAILFNLGVVMTVNEGILSRSATLGGMLNYMSEAKWATVTLTLALMRLAALAINGTWRPTPHVRAVASCCSLYVWLGISFAIANGKSQGIELAVFPVFVLLDIYNVYRASSDARVADERARFGSTAHA